MITYIKHSKNYDGEEKCSNLKLMDKYVLIYLIIGVYNVVTCFIIVKIKQSFIPNLATNIRNE